MVEYTPTPTPVIRKGFNETLVYSILEGSNSNQNQIDLPKFLNLQINY